MKVVHPQPGFKWTKRQKPTRAQEMDKKLLEQIKAINLQLNKIKETNHEELLSIAICKVSQMLSEQFTIYQGPFLVALKFWRSNNQRYIRDVKLDLLERVHDHHKWKQYQHSPVPCHLEPEIQTLCEKFMQVYNT